MNSTEPAREWVGGRLTLPARIESMGDRRAEMALWVELPDLHVVGHVLEDPEDPQASFGQSLMRAMASPLVGAPRRPRRVRVADEALAAQLRSFSFLEVEVAPTPEFDQVARSLGAFFGEASYFTDPALTAKDIENLFIAARVLWAARPWTLAADDALVRVEIPALGIDDGCVSIVGSLQEAPGFVFFPSYEDYERMAESAGEFEDGEPRAAHSALYFSFHARDEVPEGMRKEVAEHGWPLTGDDAYPMLLRMADGKPAPVLERDLKLVTAVMRALAAFALRQPQALEAYGEVEVRESQRDESDLELILSVPHPRAVDEDGAWEPPPRAQTLADVPNPYRLPLEPGKLKSLTTTLGSFTLHRVLGLFCAALTVPRLPPASAWLGEIMRDAKLVSEDQARNVLDRLMTLYNHVATTLDDIGVDGLIPEAADVEGCREWARGYAALLSSVDPADIDTDARDVVFGMHVLAENPRFLELLEETRGEDSRDAMLARCRESLADDADFLLEYWAEARAQAASRPSEATFQRTAPKVGRNDPCPCGSGKKYKKCCAVG